jgi:hypothetical protein
LIQWAQTIGPHTGQVVTTILKTKPHPEQGYRACLGLMRLTRGYDTARMEAACGRALALDSCSYKSVASILKTKLDQQPLPTTEEAPHPPGPVHENLRGPAYYQASDAGAEENGPERRRP